MPPRIVIVGQRAWRPEVEGSLGQLQPWQQRWAAAALRFLHDLHIGLTPDLAAGLAQVLTADPRVESSPWAPVERALKTPFENAGEGQKETRRSYTGMVPGAAPSYYLSRIAAPLVARACDTVGLAYLFSDDADPLPAHFRRDYRRYSQAIDRELETLASGSRLSEVFWIDRALTLSQLSRSDSATPGLPAVDVLGLAHLLRLRPETKKQQRLKCTVPRRLSDSPRYRPLLNRNQGGIDGLHQTRRLADLQSALKSEFLNPRPLLLDRLLQAGYLALRRPPLREKQRDLLVAAILPPRTDTAPARSTTSLVKASWFDAMVRLSLWLERNRLRRSEFLWIEADEWGRQRVSRCLLDQLSQTRSVPSEEPDPAYRQEFLAALGWLPDFFDDHASGRWPRGHAPREDAIRWAAAAWRSQMDHPQWGSRGMESAAAPAPEPLDRKVFDTVHLMLLLPRKAESEATPGALRHALGYPPEPGHGLSVTWLPRQHTDLERDTGWAVTTGRGPHEPLFGAPGPSAPWSQAVFSEVPGEPSSREPVEVENAVAGALLDRWLEEILRELLRDE